MVEQQRTISIAQVGAKFRSKRELYKFLQSDCSFFLPPITAINAIFLNSIFHNKRKVSNSCFDWFQVINRQDVKVSCIPFVEGLAIKDLLRWVEEHEDYGIQDYLPAPKEWLRYDRQWICDILYTLRENEVTVLVKRVEQ